MNTPVMPDLTRAERAGNWLTVNAGDNPFLKSLLSQWERNATLSDRQIEAVERNMTRKANTNPATEEGMYRTADGTIYRVKRSRNTGNLYAMRFRPEAMTRGTRFEYERGAMATIQATDRMTVADAQSVGLQFGICCVCGALLTNAQSIANGIGPVCAGRV